MSDLSWMLADVQGGAEQPPVAPQSQPDDDYWGNRPGLDLGDIIPFIGTHKSAGGALAGGVGDVLDTLARPVRTAIGEAADAYSGDPEGFEGGKIFEALYNAKPLDEGGVAPSATDLRRRAVVALGGPESGDFGKIGENETWGDHFGDIADFGLDIGIGAATDPTVWATAGLSAAGKAGQVGRSGLVRDLAGMGAVEREALAGLGAEARAAKQATLPTRGSILKKHGYAEDFQPPADFAMNNSKGYLQDLYSGEKEVNIPFLGAVPKGIPGVVAGAVVNPLHATASALGGITAKISATPLAQALKDTPLGLPAKWARSVSDFVSNPNEAEALTFAEHQANATAAAWRDTQLANVNKLGQEALARGMTPELHALVPKWVELNAAEITAKNPLGLMHSDEVTGAARSAERDAIRQEVQKFDSKAQSAFFDYSTQIDKMLRDIPEDLDFESLGTSLKKEAEATAKTLEQAQKAYDAAPAIGSQIDPSWTLPKSRQVTKALEDATKAHEEILKRNREVINFWPQVLSDPTREAAHIEDTILKPGVGAGGANKERGGVHPKLLPDGSANPKGGTPYSLAEANEAKRLAGSRQGAFTDPVEKDTGILSSLSRWRKGDAKEIAATFEKNTVAGLETYISGRAYNTVKKAELKKNMLNTFGGMPKEDWAKVIEAAKEGKNAAEIEKLTGWNPLNYMGYDAKKRVAAGGALIDNLKTGGPEGSKEFAAGAEKLKGGEHKTVFMPREVVDRYEKMLALHDKLPEWMQTMQDFIKPSMVDWKKFSTFVWPKSSIRNSIGDMVRLWQEDALDIHSPGDAARLLGAVPNIMEGLGDDFGKLGATGLAGGNLDKSARHLMQDGTISAQGLAQEMHKAGYLETGWISEELRAAAGQKIKEGPLSGTYTKYAPQVMQSLTDKYMAAVKFRETAQRLGAVAARLRAGDTLGEAMFRAEKALFNFGRISPAAKFLRDMGIAPFISYDMKNLPAQIEWVLTNPGEAAAGMRALGLLQNQQMPEHLLPQEFHNKYNMQLGYEKDENGRPILSIYKAENVIPLEDLSAWLNDPQEKIRNSLGPMVSFISKSLGPDYYDDPNERSAFKDTLRSFRPIRVAEKAWNAATGKVPIKKDEVVQSLGDVATEQLVLPFLIKKVDVLGQLKKEDTKAKADYSTVNNKLKEINGRLNRDRLAGADEDTLGLLLAERERLDVLAQEKYRALVKERYDARTIRANAEAATKAGN